MNGEVSNSEGFSIPQIPVLLPQMLFHFVSATIARSLALGATKDRTQVSALIVSMNS
jgi:hypothetical protein